jgi:7-carboxy-7-deazaguanine synthase
MFGTNKVAKRRHDDGHLHVQEVFYTIQGEGPFTGVPAVFLRLSGCNLRCTFCDTDFESSTWRPTHNQVLAKIKHLAGDHCDLVVITGGEPMLQEIGMLVAELVEHNFRVQIETAGTVWPGSFDTESITRALASKRLTLVCSPKTGNVHMKVAEHCHDWKYIIGERTSIDPRDLLPAESAQPGDARSLMLYRPFLQHHSQIWVQPQEHYTVVYAPGDLYTEKVSSHVRDDSATQAAIKRCAGIAMQKGYRLSLQTHKILGLP